jgi:hypothetical protein
MKGKNPECGLNGSALNKGFTPKRAPDLRVAHPAFRFPRLAKKGIT